MNTKQKAFLDKCKENIKEATDLYIRIMSDDPEKDEASMLLQWMVTEDINAYSVFTPGLADGFYSIETFAAIYHMLNHAFTDDGDVSFVKVKKTIGANNKYNIRKKENSYYTEPKIIFYSNWAGDFNKVATGLLNNSMYESEAYEYKFTFLTGVKEYIKEYKRVKEYYKKLHESVSE